MYYINKCNIIVNVIVLKISSNFIQFSVARKLMKTISQRKIANETIYTTLILIELNFQHIFPLVIIRQIIQASKTDKNIVFPRAESLYTTFLYQELVYLRDTIPQIEPLDCSVALFPVSNVCELSPQRSIYSRLTNYPGKKQGTALGNVWIP